MATKTITKKMIVAALKKDLVLLNKQKRATEDYIKAGCGQFLNVGNDSYCGNYEEVLRLYSDMIKWANKIISKLDALKIKPKHGIKIDIDVSNKKIKKNPPEDKSIAYINFICDSFEHTFQSSESFVFLNETEINPMDSCHHTLFPNFSNYARTN